MSNRHPLAGKPAPREALVDLEALRNAYFTHTPDMADPAQRVAFGTSGHRGTSLNGSFTDAHIAAVTQALCEYRKQQGLRGPLFIGKDTHALSDPAQDTALEVLAANGVETIWQQNNTATPTPVISHAILAHNRRPGAVKADGIIITPSHNPPGDGGFKYNPPHGGPADTDVTQQVQDRANELLAAGNRDVKRLPLAEALLAPTTRTHDFLPDYVRDLPNVVDIESIRRAKLHMAVDPLGGAALAYWQAIAEMYGLDLTITNTRLDPTFSFMRLDHDGQIRMDCSSPDAMAGLLELRSQYDLAFGNDPDADRHGVVARSTGLLNPNHYLAVAIHYLFANRPHWPREAGIGKTVVSSSLIERLARHIGRPLLEVPVGFKWFVQGLYQGTLGFGGEESAGASFLRFDGTVWSTDKDGIILCLLAAEITARTGRDPGEHYQALTALLGTPVSTRIDQPASAAEKNALKKLTPEAVSAPTMAGESIVSKQTAAPGNGAAIGGLKVSTANGWFAARPSGTENIYKIYAESFLGEAHLSEIVDAARLIVKQALAAKP